MTKIELLKKEIENLKERNKRVEANKAWELSWFRKILIAILTYFIMVIFLYIVGLPKPFINSIVPTLAFILSTLTLPIFKKVWIKYFYKNK